MISSENGLLLATVLMLLGLGTAAVQRRTLRRVTTKARQPGEIFRGPGFR